MEHVSLSHDFSFMEYFLAEPNQQSYASSKTFEIDRCKSNLKGFG